MFVTQKEENKANNDMNLIIKNQKEKVKHYLTGTVGLLNG